jgi:hypothetical protein
MNYNFDFSNLFAEPVPFNLEAVQPQRSPRLAERALGMNTGDGGDQSELLRNMMAEWARQMEAARAQEASLFAQTPRPEEYARARRYAQDPYRAAQSEMEAARAKGQTPSIDAFKAMNRIPELTPEEIMASQGNTALNQWISLRGQQGGGGGTPGGGVNPEELRRLNAARSSSSYYLPPGRYV